MLIWHSSECALLCVNGSPLLLISCLCSSAASHSCYLIIASCILRLLAGCVCTAGSVAAALLLLTHRSIETVSVSLLPRSALLSPVQPSPWLSCFHASSFLYFAAQNDSNPHCHFADCNLMCLLTSKLKQPHKGCSSSGCDSYTLRVQAVFDDYEEGDVVWCQDYHLMLLPALLKARYPKMKVSTCTCELPVWAGQKNLEQVMKRVAGAICHHEQWQLQL